MNYIQHFVHSTKWIQDCPKIMISNTMPLLFKLEHEYHSNKIKVQSFSFPSAKIGTTVKYSLLPTCPQVSF